MTPRQPRLTREIVEALRELRRKTQDPTAKQFLAELVQWADAIRGGGARPLTTDVVAWCQTHKGERLVCPRCEQRKRASGPASEKKAKAIRANARKPRKGARKGWPDVILRLHRDGSASFWSVSKRKFYEHRRHIGKTDLRLLPHEERKRLIAHFGLEPED